MNYQSHKINSQNNNQPDDNDNLFEVLNQCSG